MKYSMVFGILAIGIYFTSQYLTHHSLPLVQNQQTSKAPNVLGSQTKTSGCQANGSLPDASCTPGAIIPTATKDQICQSGYSKGVRNVPFQEKQQVYSEYGISSHQPGQYEVDHLISLELGGSNEIANLWPEPAEPRPGFHEKDLVENYLHSQVCNGSMSLQEAQQKISTGWLQVYQSVPDIHNYGFKSHKLP